MISVSGRLLVIIGIFTIKLQLKEEKLDMIVRVTNPSMEVAGDHEFQASLSYMASLRSKITKIILKDRGNR